MNSNRALHFSYVLILLPALYTGFFPGKIVYVSAICMVFYLLLVLLKRKSFDFSQLDGRRIIYFFVLYSIFSYVRSFGNIEGWRDYLAVFSGFFTTIFFPYWILLAKERQLPILFKSFMTLGIIAAIIAALYPPTDAMMTMQHNMLWLNIFIFMYGYIRKKYYLCVLLLALAVISYDLDRRSIMLGYIVPLAILVSFRILCKIKRVSFIVAACAPIVFLILLHNGTFNVFEYIEDQNEDVHISEDGRAFFVDSRTGIFEDVFRDVFDSKDKYKFFIGLGDNGKVRTLSNGASSFGFDGERSSQESGMLNYIQSGGVLGLTAYSLLILYAAYLCLFHARNRFMVMLGFFLLFKYVYSFIEDLVTFNAHTYYQFIWIGMAYNRVLRNMTDQQMKNYIRTSFDIRPFFKTLTGYNLAENH